MRRSTIVVAGVVALVAVAWWLIEPRDPSRRRPAPERPADVAIDAMPDAPEVAPRPASAVSTVPPAVLSPSEPVGDVTVMLVGAAAVELTYELRRLGQASDALPWEGTLRSREPAVFYDLAPGEFALSVAVEEELLGFGTIVFDGDPVLVELHEDDLPHVDLLVVDEVGGRVEGATAKVWPLHTSSLPATEFTDSADGRLRIGPLPPHGEYLIDVDGPAHVTTSIGPLGFAPDAIGLERRVVLRPSCRLDVRVHAADGAPVAGADVEIAWDRTERRATTDRLGVVSFADVDAADAVLTVESRRGFSIARRVAEAGDRDLQLDVVMPNAAFLEGIVRAERPQERVRLEAVPLDGDEHRVARFVPFSVTPDGAFEMGPLPEGVYELVDLFDPASRWTVRTGDPFDITLREWTTHEVDVRLLDVAGEPLAVPVVTVVDVDGVLSYPSAPRVPDDAGSVPVVWRAVGERAEISVGAEGFRHRTFTVAGERSIDVTLTPDSERRFSISSRAGHAVAIARVTKRWNSRGERFGPGPYGRARRRTLDGRAVWERSVDVPPPFEFSVGKLDREGLEVIVSVPGHFLWSGHDDELSGGEVVVTPLRLVR